MDKSKLLEGLKKIKEAFVTLQKFVDAKLIMETLSTTGITDSGYTLNSTYET